MQDLRTLFRYYYEEQYSKRKIALSLGVSVTTVCNYLRRLEQAQITWPLPESLTDEELEAMLFPDSGPIRPQPDWKEVRERLAEKGMTLDLIWRDWKEENPEGYSYGHFCECYSHWCDAQKVTARIEHKAGEKLFVDFAGKTVEIIDSKTGEVLKGQVFVATMGGSNYTYVEVVPDQSVRSWIAAHVNCLEFLGARPRVIVCDNLKAAVTRVRGKNSVINWTYKDFSRHYDIRIEPTRVRRPQDKAVVEINVKHITTHILTRLDGRQFFSFAEINQEIRQRLAELNARPFQKREGSRRSEFMEVDLPAMRPLYDDVYEFKQWKKLKVNMNYHVHAMGCYYSVPSKYVHEILDVIISDREVVCCYQSKIIARHARSNRKGSYTTERRHMPEKHRRYQDRERFLSAAREVGPHTVTLVENVLNRRSHQAQNYLAVKGILALQERYGKRRLEAACRVALASGERSYNYPSILSILETGQDGLCGPPSEDPPIEHKNLRGGDYYA